MGLLTLKPVMYAFNVDEVPTVTVAVRSEWPVVCTYLLNDWLAGWLTD